MSFKQNKSIENVGKKTGYVVAYFLFTTILFFILIFLNKLPESWSYFHIMGVVFLIALVGVIIKRILI